MEDSPYTKNFSTPRTITGIRIQDISSLGGQLGTISAGTLTFNGSPFIPDRISEDEMGSAPVREFKMKECTECKGVGRITLFTSVTTCCVCGGGGKMGMNEVYNPKTKTIATEFSAEELKKEVEEYGERMRKAAQARVDFDAGAAGWPGY